MKRLALLFSVLILASCGTTFKNVRIVDVTVGSISPDGLRGIEATVNVTADNQGKSFEVSDVTVVAKYRKSECMVFTSDNVSVEGKSTKTYSVPVYGRLAPEFSMVSLLGILSNPDLNDFDFDVQGTMTTGRQKQVITRRNIPATRLMGRK